MKKEKPGAGVGTPGNQFQKEDSKVKLVPENERVQRFVARQLKSPVYRWEEVRDPRQSRGKRWKFGELMNAMLLGFVSG